MSQRHGGEMKRKKNKARSGTQTRSDMSIKRMVQIMNGDEFDSLRVPGYGYTSLADNPEILAGCRKIASLVSMMTIYLKENTAKGDIRIKNELSKKIDISPCSYMVRKNWVEKIVMDLLVHNRGNSLVWVHTQNGLMGDLEPVAPYRYYFNHDGYGYKIMLDGVPHDPGDDLMHFVFNPDSAYPWLGRGITVPLRDVANNLKQARATEKAFMESKWKPSIVVKVDALTDEFASPEGRKKLIDSYLSTTEVGEPWLIPAEAFDVKEVRPLSLADLAINDAVQLDKRTIASILSCPPFLLGVGEFSQSEWNNFINTTIKDIATILQQTMTRDLIINPKWYLEFNHWSLLSWDLSQVANVMGGYYDRGIVDGNEARSKIGFDPRYGLDELRVLENYIPIDMIGQQNKLGGNK